MDDKIEFIDDFLMRCEDWMHGEDGKDVTLCRKYLIEIREQVKNCSIPDVVGRSEQLKPVSVNMEECDMCGSINELGYNKCKGCGL